MRVAHVLWVFVLLLASSTTGCLSTMETIDHPRPMAGSREVVTHFGRPGSHNACFLVVIDAPLTFALDVLLLPLTVSVSCS